MILEKNNFSRLRAETLSQLSVKDMATFLGLAGLAMFIPFFIHIQWISGPIINALLIIILFLSGIRSALLVALIPSLMALSGGLLPVVLAPTVPFIMISNAIYVLVIDYIYHRFPKEKEGYFLAISLASLLKFSFLFFSVSFIAKLITKSELITKVSQMLTWPQLGTALLGGVLAFIVLRWLKRI